jgi:hypothetical protein
MSADDPHHRPGILPYNRHPKSPYSPVNTPGPTPYKSGLISAIPSPIPYDSVLISISSSFLLIL